MKTKNINRLTFSILLPIGLLFILFLFSQGHTIDERFDSKLYTGIENQTTDILNLDCADNKQKGAHLFGYLDSTNLQPYINNNFEWITLVSWAAQKDFDSPTIVYNKGDSLRRIRRDSMWKSQIDIAHAQGLKVFLKPHVWLHNPSNEKWRSDIFPVNENNWNLWQKNYREFILLYAKIAEQNNVELFCVGTELSRLAVEKSDFWKSLTQDVRSVYSGQITYAANWHDEYEKIAFWDELDYIGIQAYFPLVKNKYPSVKEISKGWKKYLTALESISEKYNRKIIFTEMGYKSTADSAIKPWHWIENSYKEKKSISLETQANCYEAFFKTVWKKEWFAGVHIWQMRSDFVDNDGYGNLDFTPQGKPAEIVIANGFE